MSRKIIPIEFFHRQGVVSIAENLVGKTLVFMQPQGPVRVKIIETEAYGVNDKACHAYGFKKTPRTEVMFGPPATAYVYLCYGIHHLFNIVTNETGIPEAVLIRGVTPFRAMQTKTDGPGKWTKAIGIDKTWNNVGMSPQTWWVEEGEKTIVEASKRIGVDYAGEDANLPWRFSEQKK